MRSSVPNLRAATNKGEQDLQVCLSQVMHGGLCGAQRLMSCTVACSVAYVVHSSLCHAQWLAQWLM